MYEETKSSIDWKGIFLKVVIAFLVVLIALQGYKMFKGDNKKETAPSQTVADSKSSTTFALNLDKLTEAGKKYYEANKDLIPTKQGTTSMVTLNKLISEGYITSLVDENGKNCETESSYVTAELEGNKTVVKANLVCGTAFSNASVYLAENTENEKEETVVSDNIITNTKETSKTYTNNSNTQNKNNNAVCKESCGTPVQHVKTETKVEQKVIFNEKPATTTTKPATTTTKPATTTTTTTKPAEPKPERPTRYYIVSFDENGGNQVYKDMKVYENETVRYPGTPRKPNYTFIGWYLNGEEFDFNTPITRDIKLVAKYSRNNQNFEDDDNDTRLNYNENRYVTQYVYSLMWDKEDTNKVSVTHTLRVPETIEDIPGVDEVRIYDIDYYSPFNTMSHVNNYEDKFNDTFFYTKNGGEKNVTSKNNLSTINKSAVRFYPEEGYKDIDDAIDEGFEVRWTANSVSSQCSKTFNVVNKYTGETATNLCAYGIVYKVTWEIRR